MAEQHDPKLDLIIDNITVQTLRLATLNNLDDLRDAIANELGRRLRGSGNHTVKVCRHCDCGDNFVVYEKALSEAEVLEFVRKHGDPTANRDKALTSMATYIVNQIGHNMSRRRAPRSFEEVLAMLLG